MHILSMKSYEIVFTNNLQLLPEFNCFNSTKGFPSQNEDTEIFIIFQELVNAGRTSCSRRKQYWHTTCSEMPQILASSLKGLWNKCCSFFAKMVPRGFNVWCYNILLSSLINGIMRISAWWTSSFSQWAYCCRFLPRIAAASFIWTNFLGLT